MTALDSLREAKAGLTPEQQREYFDDGPEVEISREQQGLPHVLVEAVEVRQRPPGRMRMDQPTSEAHKAA